MVSITLSWLHNHKASATLVVNGRDGIKLDRSAAVALRDNLTEYIDDVGRETITYTRTVQI